jgi:hypothetical protein
MMKLVALSALVIMSSPVLADSKKDAPVNKATDIHGAPGNTPGHGGTSANPQGVGDGGNGIHNIAGGAPGQAGTQDEANDDQPAEDMHGGLDDATYGHSKN